MENNPLISIILPTFNGKRFLTQSIESCLSQTYKNWELIIVDDASTDEAPAIIDSFTRQDSRIRSVHHKTNKKLPGALNTGFAMARGEYLTWTSDDNLYRPHALETMLNFLLANPQSDLVYTDYSVIDENGIEVRVQNVKDPERLVVGCVVGASFLYRRHIYESIGDYAKDLFLAEDYDYWLRAFSLFNFSALHQNLYCYRKHEKSLSFTQRSRILKAGYIAKKNNIPNILHKLGRSTKALAYIHMSRDAKNLGMPVESVFNILWAFFYSPKTVLQQKN